MKEKQKVLIVDDEPNILVALEFIITSSGFVVEKAMNGKAALEIAKTFNPEIFVLDVMMPGMDGFELANIIRNTPQFSEAKIVFLTAKGAEADKMNGYSNGGEVYLTKPFDNTELKMIVSELAEFG